MEDKRDKIKHPLQPVETDDRGTLRFKENKIVSRLLEIASKHGYSLNEIAVDDFSKEDRQQFAQLIGYSLCGYSDLSYSDPNTYEIVTEIYESGTDENLVKVKYYEEFIDDLKESLKNPISKLYDKHPEDLMESYW